jgi:hypothetical protein
VGELEWGAEWGDSGVECRVGWNCGAWISGSRWNWSGVELTAEWNRKFTFWSGVRELEWGVEWIILELKADILGIDWSGGRKMEWSESGVEWKWSGLKRKNFWSGVEVENLEKNEH